MRSNLRTLLTVTVVIGALAAGPALYAQDQSTGSRGSGGMMGQGGMMQGDQGSMMGMMNMMQQMSGMMDACAKMMQSMAQRPAPEAPKEGQAPKNDG